MTQYDSYSTIPQAVRDVVANKISLLDFYILMQTGAYEYTALVYKPGLNECRQYTFTRGDNYSAYHMTETEGSFEYTVTNEYYCYSNVGYGAALDLPVTELATAHASVILACALMLAIIFKGAIFPCLRRKR